jgi:serine/threonine-protein kinase HipA
MAKRNSSKKLKVFLNAIPLGLLEYTAKQELIFVYKKEWLERSKAFPVSRSLELREEPHKGHAVYAYFDNLLPDAVSMRQRLAAKMHAESDHIFDLLAVIGRDCVGALQFFKEDEADPELKKPTGYKISESEIANKLRNLRSIPLAASEEDDFRLSIAGAQEKTAFLNLNGQWHIPIGDSPTTHIFKPQVGELKPGLSFSDSVENEWLCAEIVREFGLPVANCHINRFEEINVLVVERFDRHWHKNFLIRIPQEDFCQALGIPNFTKYEADGGPGVVQMMDLLYESTSANEDRRIFLKTQVVFYLLAAIDGHAKNFSLRWGPSGFEMAPLYDILSAQPMVDNGNFQSEKIKMSLAIGEGRHYKIRDIFRRHFMQTAKLCRFDSDEMNNIIDETISAVPFVLGRVSQNLSKKFPAKVAESIFNGMKKRLRHF